MTPRSFRIQPVMIQNQPCDGVWTDGSVAWIGAVQAYDFLKGARRTIVLPMINERGAYVPAPSEWHSLVIEPLESE
jgi:hypothetical protein